VSVGVGDARRRASARSARENCATEGGRLLEPFSVAGLLSDCEETLAWAEDIIGHIWCEKVMSMKNFKEAWINTRNYWRNKISYISIALRNHSPQSVFIFRLVHAILIWGTLSPMRGRVGDAKLYLVVAYSSSLKFQVQVRTSTADSFRMPVLA
jgi:hypothetical protein